LSEGDSKEEVNLVPYKGKRRERFGEDITVGWGMRKSSLTCSEIGMGAKMKQGKRLEKKRTEFHFFQEEEKE